MSPLLLSGARFSATATLPGKRLDLRSRLAGEVHVAVGIVLTLYTLYTKAY